MDWFGYRANRYITSENEIGVFHYANRLDFELNERLLDQIELLFQNHMLVNEISKSVKTLN